MRVLRFVGVFAVVLAAYFAGYLGHFQTLRAFFPPWLLIAAPAILPFTYWLPADLLTLALWLGLLAALGFGLVAATWRGVWGGAPTPEMEGKPARADWRSVLLAGLALLLGLAALLYQAIRSDEPRALQIVWVLAFLVYLVGVGIQRGRRLVVDFPHPERSWPLFLLLLLAAALILGWPLAYGASMLDDASAQAGLRALDLLHGETATLFSDAPVTLGVTALAIALVGDPLTGVRLAGLTAGLLAIWAVWLLACELFRRPSVSGAYGEIVEDDGRWVALLAPALLLVSPPLLYASHFPMALEPVVWGVFGLWAWLRGVRLLNPLALALSGVLIGLTSSWYTSGLAFLPLIPLWWLGLWILQPAWAQRLRHGVRGAAVLWFGGWLIASAPQLGLWIRSPEQLLARFQGALLPNLATLLTVFNLDSDQTPLAGYPNDALAFVVAPLLILAVGVLLLNLDRLVGWVLATWLVSGLVMGAELNPLGLAWPLLLPLLPALALILAFTADRLRVTLIESGGSWLSQATTYLAIGLVVWAGLKGWLEVYQLADNNGNLAGAVAQAVRSLPADRPVVLVVPTEGAQVTWQTPAIRFLTAHQPATAPRFTLEPGVWPVTLPPQSVLLLPPTAQALRQEISARYPGGQWRTERDLFGNPLLLRYELA